MTRRLVPLVPLGLFVAALRLVPSAAHGTRVVELPLGASAELGLRSDEDGMP